jgi:cytochrome c-type biogenesis protein CcmH
MQKMQRRNLIFLVLFCSFPLYAADVPLADMTQEKRAQSLFREIRCMVCASETIADSHVEVASDMRMNIRSKIEVGVSDEAIKQNLADKYGDVILMKPPFKSGTALLWFGPWIILLLGMVGAYFYFRGAKKS